MIGPRLDAMRDYVYIALLLVVAFVGWLFLFWDDGRVVVEEPDEVMMPFDPARPRNPMPLVTITAPVKFIERSGNPHLVVADDELSFEFLWFPHAPSHGARWKPIDLVAGDTCTFTIEIERFGISREEKAYAREIYPAKNLEPGVVKIPNLVRIVRDGKVIYDREFCEVHKIKMAASEVPIVYGLIRPQGVFPRTQETRTLFPNRSDLVLGGCCPTPRTTELIFVCPACKEAYEKWEKQNNPPDKSTPPAASP